ncbi:MAG TPA: hypothetical protein VFK19_12130 [Sphingomicrobium sp.]|nr:hypothetical protein [Sphingomicrobium sp.]
MRQEDISRDAKGRYARLVKTVGLDAGGRSDLHVYFWGQALAVMAPDARLGFLAPSQWLDAEYGFKLQAFLLENFRIEAIVESRDEPWFVGARVATVATMATREADPEARDDNLVRFVQIQKPIAALLAHDDTSAGALEAAENFRKRVLACATDTQGDGWRVRVRRQGDLRVAGVRLGERTKGKPVYVGGKWGIPLRAPDLWEELLQAGGERWRPLAEIADVRFGVKSGKDDFFYVADWSRRGLEDFADPAGFAEHFGVARREVESGRVTLAKTGTGEVHPIESEYLAPIVHSLMDIDAYRIERRHCDKLALMVSNPAGEHVRRYIEWGEQQGFHRGATCEARANARAWYNLVPDVIPSDVLWVKERQYRFAALANPEHYAANCRLYTVAFDADVDTEAQAAILNSSVVVLSTLQFGRPVGVEGAWSTMVLDANMLLVPAASDLTRNVRTRLLKAHSRMAARGILGFVSERRLRQKSFIERGRETELATLSDETELDQADRRELDDAVLELLGIGKATERERLLDALYAHLRDYFESVRVREEEAIDNKRKAAQQGTLGVDQIVADVLAEIERDHPNLLRGYADLRPGTSGDGIRIPASGEPIIVDDLVTCGVRFAEGRKSSIVPTRTKEQAELVAAIAAVGPRGRSLFVPHESEAARELTARLRALAVARRSVSEDLILARTADPDLVERSRQRVLSQLVSGVAGTRRGALAA